MNNDNVLLRLRKVLSSFIRHQTTNYKYVFETVKPVNFMRALTGLKVSYYLGVKVWEVPTHTTLLLLRGLLLETSALKFLTVANLRYQLS